MINSKDTKGLKSLLEKTNYKPAENSVTASEYRDQFNANRLYGISASQNQSYVSKRANAESEFWQSGKIIYDDKKMNQKMMFKSTTRNNFSGNEIPEKFTNKDHSMRKTRITEYSNALFNGTVFINPTHLSC